MIVKASAWSIAGSLIEKILMLAAYVIVTRQVDKLQFGLLVLVLLFTELLAYVAGMGISQNIIRAEKLGDDFMTSNKHFNRLVAAALTGVMLLILAPGAYYFHSAELAKLTLIMAFYPALPALASFYMAIMRRDMRFKELAIRTAGISLLSGLTGILLALAGAGVYALIAAKYAYSLADWWILKKLTKFISVGKVDRQHLRETWDMGWKLSSAQVFNYSSSRVYELFISTLFGPIYLAVLDVGRKFITTFFRMSLTPLNNVALPYLSRSKDPIAAYFAFVRVIAALVVPVAAIMGSLSVPLTLVFFGEKWAESAVVGQIISFGVVVQVLTWHLNSLMVKYGKSGLVLNLQIAAFVVLVVFGAIGALAKLPFHEFVALLVAGTFVAAFIKVITLKYSMSFPIFAFCWAFVESFLIFGFNFIVSDFLWKLIVVQVSVDRLGYFINGLLQLTLCSLFTLVLYLPYLVYLYRRYRNNPNPSDSPPNQSKSF